MSRGKHGSYEHWLCVTCGFGIPANQWRVHRLRCFYRLPRGSRCHRCWDFIPCRKIGCVLKEVPIELPDENPGIAPRAGVVKSLGMAVTRTTDGRWVIRAPWLDGPVIGNTWPEAYDAAVRAK